MKRIILCIIAAACLIACGSGAPDWSRIEDAVTDKNSAETKTVLKGTDDGSSAWSVLSEDEINSFLGEPLSITLLSDDGTEAEVIGTEGTKSIVFEDYGPSDVFSEIASQPFTIDYTKESSGMKMAAFIFSDGRRIEYERLR